MEIRVFRYEYFQHLTVLKLWFTSHMYLSLNRSQYIYWVSYMQCTCINAHKDGCSKISRFSALLFSTALLPSCSLIYIAKLNSFRLLSFITRLLHITSWAARKTVRNTHKRQLNFST